MPADFDTNITAPLGRLRALTAGATSFASDIVSLLTAAFGTSNPFGTAATRDTGTAEGNVPLLGAGGRIEPSLLPTATTIRSGGVLLARDINDARAEAVATAAQVASFAAGVATGLNAANFTATQLQDGVDFTAPTVGLIVIGGAGGGGHRPPASRLTYTTDGQGANAADSYLWFGNRRTTSERLRVRGGYGGARRASTQITAQGLSFATVPAGDNRPDFAVVMAQKGAPGGVGGSYGEGTAQTEYVGLPGGDGELLIAKVQAATYRVTLGAAGAGGAALAGLSNDPLSPPYSIAGGNGLNAFAFYLRLV